MKYGMEPHIVPFSTAALAGLQSLWNRQLAPHAAPDLTHDLQDAAHGNGTQVAIAWRGGEPAGCVGWVTLGIPENGCAYAAPMVAADMDVALRLVDLVVERTRAAGARRLRVSTRAGEEAKLAALRERRFAPQFEFAGFAHGLPLPDAGPWPEDLHPVQVRDIDWPSLHRCMAEAMAGVPNTVVADVDTVREDWQRADPETSLVLADASNEYQAFLLMVDNKIDTVGVRQAWRGRDLPAKLYRHASEVLRLRGHTDIRVPLVASINAASMRLHQKLGFTECVPRITVHELTL
jgi:GNAT superfamily N-acetyltransferase